MASWIETCSEMCGCTQLSNDVPHRVARLSVPLSCTLIYWTWWYHLILKMSIITLVIEKFHLVSKGGSYNSNGLRGNPEINQHEICHRFLWFRKAKMPNLYLNIWSLHFRCNVHYHRKMNEIYILYSTVLVKGIW